ncbi:MAG: hypothetical protein ACK5ME_11040 [Parahaliea sp.]
MDILINTGGKVVHEYFSEELHFELFSMNEVRNHKLLRNIKDYYLTDFTMSPEAVCVMVRELNFLKRNKNFKNEVELDLLLAVLGQDNVLSVRFSGD